MPKEKITRGKCTTCAERCGGSKMNDITGCSYYHKRPEPFEEILQDLAYKIVHYGDSDRVVSRYITTALNQMKALLGEALSQTMLHEKDAVEVLQLCERRKK